MNLKTIKRVYLLCPANVKTGGPELLHQLCFQLNSNGKEAYMVYYSRTEGVDPTHDDFKRYNPLVCEESNIEDSSDNLIIVPEIKPDYYVKFKNIKKGIWWLSVDNFSERFTFMGKVKRFGILRAIYHMPNEIKYRSYVKKADCHFCQSFYSRDYLNKVMHIKNNIYDLSDYVSENYLNLEVDLSKKQNGVCYFPRKGYNITKELIAKAPNINWVRIENMTTTQVQETLCKNKVYIDFGHFPGKDRVPREAASCMCCIITGTKGASKFYEDVPLDSKYKFEKPLQNLNKIISEINNCLENYDEVINDFSTYRQVINGEKEKFLNEIKSLFLED